MTVKELLSNCVYTENITVEVTGYGEHLTDDEFDIIRGMSPFLDDIASQQVINWMPVGKDRIRIKIW